MDTSGIHLMAFSKSSEKQENKNTSSTSSTSPTTAYDNPAFQFTVEKPSDSSLSSKDFDDATAINTHANSARPSLENIGAIGTSIADPTASTAAPSSTAASTASTTATAVNNGEGGGRPPREYLQPPDVGGGLSDPAGNPVLAPGRHKDSTVGFRLPEESTNRRDRRPSGNSAKSAGVKDKHGDPDPNDQPYRGMGKEDLLRHSGKPFWRRLRYMCMSVVMVGWLALIITVVALVLIYPRCRKAPEQRWWKTAVMYRIYVRSFQDHDGDGIGDLDGIRSRLGYLEDIGVTTISLSPIYTTSAGNVSDTHIVNHKEVAREYGDLNKFIRLVNASHAHGIQVLLDFIPNHTGLDHPWFLESRNGTTNPKRNFYVWENGAGDNQLEEPNNWRNVYNHHAWTWSFVRSQYYLHQYHSSQPDLNLRSSEVKEQLQSILKYWLDLGVDGFYVRDSGFLFEDYDIRDEILRLNKSDQADQYSSYHHTYTYGRNEIYDMFARWRAYLDDYGNRTGKYKILFADRTGEISQVMEYYGHFNRDGVNFPLNTFCLNLGESTRGQAVAKVVRQWIDSMPHNRWANWLGGADSSPRMMDRLGENAARPFLTLIMLLPGTPMLYYGDEIGMTSSPGVQTEVQAGQRALSMRSPMQWDNTTHSGFCDCTKGRPWMAVNPSYLSVNVESERAGSDTIFHLFTNLTSLRAEYESFHYGDYNEAVVDQDVFSFVRDFDGEKGFLVALNFANVTVEKNYGGTYYTIPGQASVALVTGSDVKYHKGDKVSTSGLELGPHQGVVLEWDYVAKEL